jgi:hypothetical protein
MNAPLVNMNPAPPVSRAAAAAADPREEAAQAWRREMERAQMEAWLAHGVVGSAGLKPATPGWSPLPAAVHVAASAAASPLETTARPHDGATSSADQSAGPPEQEASNPAVARKTESLGENGRAPASKAARGEAGEASAARTAVPMPLPVQALPASALPHAVATTQVPGPAATAQMVSALEGMGPIAATTSVSGLPATSAAIASDPGLAQRLPSNSLAANTIMNGASPSGERAKADPAASVQRGATARVAAANEPIRLHADWSAEGVRLWLGMDAPAADALQAITLQLQRWLSAQGVRLLSISCNGRVVVEEKDASTDTYQSDVHPGEPVPAAYPHPHQKESS